MNVLGRITAMPTLPKSLVGLKDVAYNLWWSWNPEAQRVFEQLSPLYWKRFRGNPVKALLESDPDRLKALSSDMSYLGQVEAVVASYDQYLKSRPQFTTPVIAYFSMEFGFHESLPIYSGGLGILAGDHVKAASDLGVNLTAIGMFYHQGYFRQQLTPEGQQQEVYDEQHPEELPLVSVLDANQKPLRIGIDFPSRTVWVTAYKAQVGIVPVYLLSTNLPENSPEDRKLTARLYDPGQEMRIQQEVVLGIGGVRVLRALGLDPKGWHMNEGHAAFIGLERIREMVAAGTPFAEALERVASGSLFTTHTPVPAGHDSFGLDLIDRYLNGWWSQLGITRDEFLALGLEQKSWGPVFSMSNLALRLSRASNGVSKLHGEVSRDMFKHIWAGFEPEEVPVGHVTNGVHTWTFLHPELYQIYRNNFPSDWREKVHHEALWKVDSINEVDLWNIRNHLRNHLVSEVRARLIEQRRRNGEGPSRLRSAEKALDPGALTIGFARRFATYKRAVLLFRDPERLVKILNGPHPVQFVFAGKAHPQDEPGKAFIKELVAKIKEHGLENKIILLENYDMGLARALVQGVDIWLNTPRRPMEASGTSGMKAALNGALNFSVLDGWWAEAFNSRNGWQIGDERTYASEEAQDVADAQAFYYTLEKEILPLFYARGAEGTPSGWLTMVRESIKSVGPTYSASRMVDDYVKLYYEPLTQRAVHQAEQLAAVSTWKQSVRSAWSHVRLSVDSLGDTITNGVGLSLNAKLVAPGLDPQTLRVELVVRRSSGDLEVVPLDQMQQDGDTFLYHTTYLPKRPGSYTYGLRAVAQHPDLSGPREVAFVKWA